MKLSFIQGTLSNKPYTQKTMHNETQNFYFVKDISKLYFKSAAFNFRPTWKDIVGIENSIQIRLTKTNLVL